MRTCILAALAALAVTSHASQPGAAQPIAWPSKPLVWGDVNFLSTTDTHGWLMGHTKSSQPEPNYSADFGDFLSFVTHMKAIADEKGVDLLLVDAGDIHDGTGLSDGSPYGGINGQESNEFIKQLPYDILAVGNHELYNYSVALDTYQHFASHWNGGYLSSNADITIEDPPNSGHYISVPLGDRYRKFTTTQGRTVTAFGVLHNFTWYGRGLNVQTVDAMVKEAWFREAIQDEPDFFLLVGHMPVHSFQGVPEMNVNRWPVVFDAIRAVHNTTPIFIFGGHSHTRNCTQLDARSMSLQSGRYMETVGWLSANVTNVPATDKLSITRRYLDTNRNTYKYHTRTDDETFDTEAGIDLSEQIYSLSTSWNLSEVFGVVPQDYYLDRFDYPHKQSIHTLFMDEVLPTMLSLGQPNRSHIAKKVLANRGTVRFDLYEGPFTRNDQFTVLPFTNDFVYLTIPWSIAKRVVDVLNEKREQNKEGQSTESRQWKDFGDEDGDNAQQTLMKRGHVPANWTLGYVTDDFCPGWGDDTLHKDVGNLNRDDAFIGSPDPQVLDTDAIDLIMISFIRQQVIDVVNELQTQRRFTEADLRVYGPYKSNTIFEAYARYAWSKG